MNNYFMSDKITEFGRLCRTYRASLGMNMANIANITEKTQSTITKIEQGKIPVSLEFIKKSIKAYKIEEIPKQMEFLLFYLNSSEAIEIPLAGLSSRRKEWLTALLILGDINLLHPKGWDELMNWINSFSIKLNELKPGSVTLGDKYEPL
jgi:transcriptional regulator with XRE-family HTH domain